MELLIPFRLTTAAFVMLGFTVLFVALRILFMQRKRPVLQGGEQPEPAITNHFARLMIIPMFMMLLMPIIIFFPIYSPSGLLLRRNLVWAAIALCFIGMAVGGYRTWQKSRTPLSSGEWCDLVQGMAHLAGLQVRRVDLVPSPTLNAYATLFGSVGLTTALIQKLDRAEVKAIVAHELGHIKLRHLWKQFVISVICTGTLWLIWYMLRSALMPHASDEMRSIFSSMLFFLLFSGIPVAAITGFGRRKREHEADMLAVHWTGDPELVIRALTKVHTLNASPHLLKPGDELISGHPSLVNRIKAIRAQTAS